MGQYRPLNFEDRLLIEKLSKENKSYRVIAKSLNKSPSTVYNEWFRAGGREKYSADAAQADCDRKKAHSYRELVNSNLAARKKRTIKLAFQRIEAIEDTLKILCETIQNIGKM